MHASIYKLIRGWPQLRVSVIWCRNLGVRKACGTFGCGISTRIGHQLAFEANLIVSSDHDMPLTSRWLLPSHRDSFREQVSTKRMRFLLFGQEGTKKRGVCLSSLHLFVVHMVIKRLGCPAILLDAVLSNSLKNATSKLRTLI